MDLGYPLFSVCVIMICLLGAPHCSNGVNTSCPCPEIPERPRTEPSPPGSCFKINNTFRYKCARGYVREAGTSNLIKCKQTHGTPQWYPSPPSLKCITDPNITPTQPPNSKVKLNTSCPCPKIPERPRTEPPPPGSCFKINNTFRYACATGYVRKVGTSNLIKCNETDGTPQWSSPNLQCIPDPNGTPTQPLNSTETQGHTDIPHDSTFTATVTAASSSLQMTHAISPSASVTAETGRAETTSPGPHSLSGHLQAEKVNATQRTTSNSTTAEPSNHSTFNPLVFHPVARTVIGCVSLMTVCALIGITFFCYRRRSKSTIPPTRPEEQEPMNRGPSEPDL